MRMKRKHFITGFAALVLLIVCVFAFSFSASAAAKKPSAVTGFEVKAAEFKVKCTWKPVSNAQGYVIYYKDTATKKTAHTAPITGRSKSSYTVKGLTNKHKYQFIIYAYRYIGGKYYYSKASALKTATPVLYRPGKPMIQIGDIDSGQVTLNWKSVFGATSYQVYIRKSNGKYKLLEETKKRSVTITSLTDDARYTFAVRSVRTVNGKKTSSKIDSITVWVRSLKDQIADINDKCLYTGYMNRTVTAKRINGSGKVTITKGTQIGIVGWSTTIQLRNGVKCKVSESDFTRTHNMFDEPRAGYGKSVAEYYVNHWKNSRGKYTNTPIKSSTKYLLWANPYTEHTYVFTKNKNKTWSLLYSWNCITGKYEHQSEYGVWKIIKKKPRMEFPGCYANYGCLFTSDGNAFHSLRYSNNGAQIDPSGFVGKAASAGCIRLEIDNIKFIYNKIPIGTTVIIH